MPTGTRPAPPVSTARVAVSGVVFNHRWTNVFYLNITHSGSVTVDDLKTIADGIAATWDTNVSPQVSNVVAMDTVTIVFFPSSGTELVYAGTYSHVGHGTTPLNDASACIVVDWLIDAYYRGGKPRTYIAGVKADLIDEGSLLDSTYRSGTATAFNALRNAINALTSTNITAAVMGTVSFSTAGAWRVPPVFRPYTSVKIRSVLGSQRRRLTT